MGEAKIPPGTLGETLGLSSPWGLPPDLEPRQFKTIFLEPLHWLLLNQAPLRWSVHSTTHIQQASIWHLS